MSFIISSNPKVNEDEYKALIHYLNGQISALAHGNIKYVQIIGSPQRPYKNTRYGFMLTIFRFSIMLDICSFLCNSWGLVVRNHKGFHMQKMQAIDVTQIDKKWIHWES